MARAKVSDARYCNLLVSEAVIDAIRREWRLLTVSRPPTGQQRTTAFGVGSRAAQRPTWGRKAVAPGGKMNGSKGPKLVKRIWSVRAGSVNSLQVRRGSVNLRKRTSIRRRFTPRCCVAVWPLRALCDQNASARPMAAYAGYAHGNTGCSSDQSVVAKPWTSPSL